MQFREWECPDQAVRVQEVGLWGEGDELLDT